ncbi:hypothetical protein KP509_35G051500 [Ceratopteris richardii]|uniref:Uncharacterized protein n=1 Tax=Ceratopteris richardii TaxID=49495 RepID=A0A8T2QGN8_CERRI|nr:hypothetical protein KP509_35G051500 [Ceratopteris richardii]
MTTVERVLNARSVVPVASSSASLTYLSTTSTFSAVHLLHLKPFSSLLRSSSTSFFAGKSGYVLESRRGLRSSRRSHLALTNLIKAAFLVEWIGKLINFLAKTPAKMFAQKLEDDLDKAAKMVKTAAGIVASIARETDEFAEEVERIAEQTEKFAEKVSEVTEKIETEIDDILDVIEVVFHFALSKPQWRRPEGSKFKAVSMICKLPEEGSTFVNCFWMLLLMPPSK